MACALPASLHAVFSHISQAPNGSLVIESVSELDEGTYTCRATNDFGSDEIHVIIEVLQGLAMGLMSGSYILLVLMVISVSVFFGCCYCTHKVTIT